MCVKNASDIEVQTLYNLHVTAYISVGSVFSLPVCPDLVCWWPTSPRDPPRGRPPPGTQCCAELARSACEWSVSTFGWSCLPLDTTTRCSSL